LVGLRPAGPVPARPAEQARAGGDAPDLPHYDLGIRLDLREHRADVCQRVTWTNPGPTAVNDLVFNVHSHYRAPDADVGFASKMLEIVRVQPGEMIDTEPPPCTIRQARRVVGEGGQVSAVGLRFHYRGDSDTTLVVDLPEAVRPGQAVTVELTLTVQLSEKQGRWGYWKGVTLLSGWLPVLAYRGAGGWEPVPFVTWYQPTFNEAGRFQAL